MKTLWNMTLRGHSRLRQLTLVGLILLANLVEARSNPLPTFQLYCFQCHGNAASMAGVNLERMTSQSSVSSSFKQWINVVAALEQKRMPPEGMPQPTEEERGSLITWIRSELDGFVKKHAGDPGRVTVRRLTSGEYGYSIQDLTGLDLKVEHDLVSDEVGGEGFSNFGDVQFIQDAGMERYLEAAKRVADHAVIGWGPSNSSPIPARLASNFRRSRASGPSMTSTDFGPSLAKGDGLMDWTSTAKLCM